MQEHWERVYGTKAPDQVSWFRPHLETSLSLIERAIDGNLSASIVDVGGGASTLVDDLTIYWIVATTTSPFWIYRKVHSKRQRSA